MFNPALNELNNIYKITILIDIILLLIINKEIYITNVITANLVNIISIRTNKKI